MSRLLLIDAGNTALKFAFSSGSSDGHKPNTGPVHAISTADAHSSGVIEQAVHRVFDNADTDPASVDGWAVSSVTPSLDKSIAAAAGSISGCKALFLPDTLPIPLKNGTDEPESVGSDRLATALAAWTLAQADDIPGVLVADFGTATTFECVSRGIYHGGLICPGIESSAKALAAKTEKLPMPKLDLPPDIERPRVRWGTTTESNLTNGFLFGFAAMAEGLVKGLLQDMPLGTRVYGTGGYAAAIARITHVFDEIRPDLLFTGLRAAWEYNRK